MGSGNAGTSATLKRPFMAATNVSRVSQIASMRRVHEAFQWLHLHEPQIMRWQVELVSIPAPPFAERARAQWLVERFRELGLKDPHLDEAGNALAILSGRHGTHANATSDLIQSKVGAHTGSSEHTHVGTAAPLVLLSAHIDTVFPARTPIEPLLEGSRLSAPGACDNGAGVVALLALAAALIRSGLAPDGDILFAGNVGEEGEGDLRGMRHLYASPAWRNRIAAHLVLDGAGHEIAVTTALGSRRFEVILEGPGGHSWTDAGRPNPIAAMSEAIATMNRLHLAEQARLSTPPGLGDAVAESGAGEESPWRNAAQPGAVAAKPYARGDARQEAGASSLQRLPGRAVHVSPPQSAWNVGTIEGGASVNAIPEQAKARFDLRSTDPAQLVRLEVELHRAVEDAVLAANAAADVQGAGERPLRFSITPIGSRPAGTLAEGARILGLLRAVDRHLNLRSACRTASTDANIPLSLGVEAISIGAGGDGGGIHTRSEWYDARGRDLGLRRVLLLLVALAAQAELAVAAD